ncbi:MAM and LDL-receptor class A domain-containing protein 2-like [Homarus americanus]|uniref:MAM and LDL-receptor class A domain-containing protein 2-like n=1 Tax=Homarus americanus TaxID=6706 RepID=UPI001C497AED|nr:MAM and LDL-receptor class A domain-containing protein 2-like [Homarus americanus]
MHSETYTSELVGDAYIALDDIQVTPGACSGSSSTPNPSSTTKPPKLISCNFESGSLCGWSQDMTDGGDWDLVTGNMLNGDTYADLGPAVDHTSHLSGGHFIFVSQKMGKGVRIRLQSEDMPPSATHCFTFYYYMHGSHPNNLNLYLVQDEFEPDRAVDWHAKGELGELWHQMRFFVPNSTVNQFIIFEASLNLGSVDDGHTAIDDIRLLDGSCSSRGFGANCDFEASDKCEYTIQNFDESWGWSWGADAAKGPATDHTYGEADGHYMYLNYEDDQVTQSVLTTPYMRGDDDSMCVKWYYYISGPDDMVAGLNVSVSDVGTTWFVNEPMGDSWNLGNFTVTASADFKVAFEGSVYNPKSNVIIAIDDVVVDAKACPAAATCTFEGGLCDWASDTNGDITWVLQSGSTPTANTGPQYDHTLNSIYGHYMLMSASIGWQGSQAFLRSPPITGGDYCFEFYYYMSGQDIGALRVIIETDGGNKTVFDREGNQAEEWRLGRIGLPQLPDFVINIVGVVGSGTEGDLAIDDTWTSYGVCPDIPDKYYCKDGRMIPSTQVCDFHPDCSDKDDEENCGECDFENGMCGWTAFNSKDYMWKIGHNLTRNYDGKFIYDHTLGTPLGHFLYVLELASGDSGPAALVTRPHHNSQLYCAFIFWYRENANMGPEKAIQLSVNVERSEEVTPVSYFVNRAVDTWTMGQVMLQDWPGEFVVRVEAMSTAPPTDLTLDDFSFDNCYIPHDSGNCLPNQLTCNTGMCVDDDLICDMTNDCGDMSDERDCFFSGVAVCTFEGNQKCDWTQEAEQDDKDWQLGSGPTPAGRYSHLTGPPVDHTTRLVSGHYLYISEYTTKPDARESSPRRAWLLSPVLQAKEEKNCVLRFHYYMYGMNIQQLNVYIRWDLYSAKTLVFSRTGEQGQFWDRGTVPSQSTQSFQFVIEGVIRYYDYIDIAIDDLSFSSGCVSVNGTLPLGTTPAPPFNPCGDDQFYCGIAYECISKADVCNWVTECMNGADEANCQDCSFENGMCMWNDVSEGVFSWRRLRADDLSPYDHPALDHTFGTSGGHYAFLTEGAGVEGKTAVLHSSKLSNNGGLYCEFHVWLYRKESSNVHALLYFKDEDHGDTVLLSNFSTQFPHPEWWNEMIIPVHKPLANYLFSLEATPVFDDNVEWAKSHTMFAVDDIELLNCNFDVGGLDCNFDDPNYDGGYCMWRQSINDQLDWKKSDMYPEDLHDHTTGKTFYVYADFSDEMAETGDKAILESTVQSKTTTFDNVFSLWYYFFGENVGVFRLIQKKMAAGVNNTYLELKDSQDDRWMLFEARLDGDDDFMMMLEAEWREIGPGLLAVDDIKMTQKLQSSKCDFEVDFCQWSQGTTETTKWTRANGKDKIPLTPPVDHTANSEMGYYAYLAPTGSSDDFALLTSPVYESIGTQCFRIWYHMPEQGLGQLIIFVKEDNSSDFTPIETWTNSTYEMWSLGMVTLPNTRKLSVGIMGVTGLSDAGLIAIDDLEFIPDSCPRAHECDFECDLCDWFNINGGDDTFDWERASGVDGGGIIVDHTINFETGHYMVAHLKDKTKRDAAKLYSSRVPHNLNCITFWYSMQNIVNSTLSVVLRVKGIDSPLISLHNSTLDFIWEEVKLTPIITSNTFQIIFDIFVDENITASDIDPVALDDIAFTSDCEISTLPPFVTTPLPTHTPSFYDCNFEEDSNELCGWTQDTMDSLDWQRHQGPTPTEDTGPNTDHTLKTDKGHYIYVGTSYGKDNVARLVSNPVDIGRSGACFSFWYHMHGPNIGNLEVLLQSEGSNSTSVWKRSREQGIDWLPAKVFLDYVDARFDIILKASPWMKGKGDIAVDDITVDFMSCFTGQLCDFEKGTCNFRQSVEDPLDWERVSATPSEGRIRSPSEDHSRQTSLGHYFRLTGVGSALMYSDTIHPQFKCAQFWIFSDSFYNNEEAVLEVYKHIDEATDDELLVKITGIFSREWNLFRLRTDSTSYYSLGFKGQSFNDTIIGIDDVQPLVSCEDMLECNFETDLCMWRNAEDGLNTDWSLMTADQLSNPYGPKVDVTSLSQYGGFIYFDTSGEAFDSYASLKTDMLEPGVWCVSFWYHLQGLGHSSLSLGMDNDEYNARAVLWEHNTIVHADWEFVQVTANITLYATVLDFIAVSDHGQQGIIALDKVVISANNCTNGTIPDCTIICDADKCIKPDQMCNFVQDCSQGQDENFCGYNCTFEAGVGEHCTWRNVEVGGELSWAYLQGQDTNNTYGPPVDHTLQTGAGHYVAVAPRILNNRDVNNPIFMSPGLYNSAAECRMLFWYVMYEILGDKPTEDVGTLKVSYNVSDITTTLLEIYSNHREEWMYGMAYIGRIRSEFTVQFEGEKNFDVDGYMAIDDLSFEKCFLPSPQHDICRDFFCTNLACVSMFEECDFVDDCGDYSDEDDTLAGCDKYVGRCNFEDSSSCDWVIDKDSSWQIGSPSTQDIIPLRDHTRNTADGSFMYIESNDKQSAATQGIVTSPVIFSPSVLCLLRFYYYSYGPEVNQLVVSVRDSSNGLQKDIKVVSGSIGQYWDRIEIMPPSEDISKLLEFVLTGSTLNYTGGLPSVIAIDDISFTKDCTPSNDTLPTVTIPSTTTTENDCHNQYPCLNGKCIPNTEVCDFKDDCGDNSDEIICAECSFDVNQCGWADQSYGSSRWMRASGSPYGRDSYVMKVFALGAGTDTKGDLVSYKLGASATSCTMSFYFMKGGKDSTLELNLLTNNMELTLWLVYNDFGEVWQNQTVGILARDFGWKLRFRVQNFDDDGHVIIDEVHFHNCALPVPHVCPDDQFTCGNGVCVNDSQVCDFSNDCGDNTDEYPDTCEQFPERCNFEADFCHWQQHTDDDELDWMRKNGEMLDEDVGPDYDHTYGNETGFYLYLRSIKGSQGQNAKISGPPFLPSTGDCHFRFWFMMRNHLNSSLRVSVVETNPKVRRTDIIFQTTGTDDYLWVREDLPITYSRYFQILIEGWAGAVDDGDIAIDDISYSTKCRTTMCSDYEFFCPLEGCISNTKVCDFRNDCNDYSDEDNCPAVCHFENDTCGWQDVDETNAVKWIRAQANDTNSGTDVTGPFTDQTGNDKGHFLLLHQDYPDIPLLQEAQAFTHWYQNSKPDCSYSFWYYRDEDLGGDVLLRLNSTSDRYTTIKYFSRKAATSHIWTFQDINIGRHITAFQLSLYLLEKEGETGVFAIDETKFEDCGYPPPVEGNCAPSFYHCALSQICIPKENMCDLADDCGYGEDETPRECSEYHRSTFEDGMLGWFVQGQNGVDDDTDWILASGREVSYDKGPNYDHTEWSPEGIYLYMDVPDQQAQTAQLLSLKLYSGSNCTFLFYHYFYGPGFGNLTVSVRQESGSTKTVFSMESPADDSLSLWDKVQLTYLGPLGEGSFQIIIEVRSAVNHQGTIALDDFVFDPKCWLAGVTTTSTPHSTVHPENCTNDEFKCSDGPCIPIRKHCNFVFDCANDEDGCVSTICPFLNGDQCGWEMKATNHTKLSGIGSPDDDPEDDVESEGKSGVLFTWELSTGNDQVAPPLQQYKPGVDHTFHDVRSYYAYVWSVEDDYDDVTDLATEYFIGETAKTCRLGIWYWWSGPQSGSLHVLVTPFTGDSVEAWLLDGDNGNQWQMVQVGLGELNVQKVRIQAHRGISYEGGGAVDDIAFEECVPPSPPPDGMTCKDMNYYPCSDGTCVVLGLVCDYSDDCLDNSDEAPEVCGSFLYRCDFEFGITSDWTEDIEDNADWLVMRASSDNSGTLPVHDHTLGTTKGHYVVLNVMDQSKTSRVARLHSPVIVSTVYECQIRFWYQATGDNPGHIRVLKRISYYENGTNVLSTISNMAKNVWLKFSLTYGGDPYSGDFQVVLEGASPADRNGFLILDDLSMSPECERSSNQHLPGEDDLTTPKPFCPLGKLDCANGKCYSPIETCNFVDDCGDGTDEQECSKSCDFETDLCGWFEQSADSSHWTRTGFPADPPGPAADYTGVTTTHDLSSSKNQSLSGQVAILESHVFSMVGHNCIVSFYHYLGTDGDQPSTLSLYRKTTRTAFDSVEGIYAELLWEQSENSKVWDKEYVMVSDVRDFSLFFKATHGDQKTYIAIDDLAFKNCEPSDECTSTTDFTCADASCIPRQYRCDAKYDCPDKSDEFQCDNVQGDCNFDHENWLTACGWQRCDDDDKDWSRGRRSFNSHYGPSHDHTLGSSGYYLYVASDSDDPGKVAAIKTGTQYPASTDICYIRFWYYLHNDNRTANPGSLRLYLEDSTGKRWPLVVRIGNYEALWQEEVKLVSSSKPFQFVFEGETGDPRNTYVALDDVSFTPECPSGVGPPPINNTCGPGMKQCNTEECIPASFFCDCYADCVDGSDEQGCSITCSSMATRPLVTTTPTTTTTKGPHACLPTQFPCGDGSYTCIPGLLLCDGITDCPNAADEQGCPASTPCEPGYVYCADRYMQNHPCLRVETVCNGYPDCNSYLADESLCGTCPSYYCQHGKCSVSGKQAPTCSCNTYFNGTRCSINTGTDTGLSSGAIAGIVIGSLIALALAGVVIFVIVGKKSPPASGVRYVASPKKTDETDASFMFAEPSTSQTHPGESYLLEDLDSPNYPTQTKSETDA